MNAVKDLTLEQLAISYGDASTRLLSAVAQLLVRTASLAVDLGLEQWQVSLEDDERSIFLIPIHSTKCEYDYTIELSKVNGSTLSSIRYVDSNDGDAELLLGSVIDDVSVLREYFLSVVPSDITLVEFADSLGNVCVALQNKEESVDVLVDYITHRWSEVSQGIRQE